jgi:hypothetical protein
MDYIFAFAGIPNEIFSDIKAEFSNIAGKKCTFISRPLSKDHYTESDKNYYLAEFAKYLESDHENQLAETKFGLIYINHPHDTSSKFSSSFFPFILSARVDWSLDQSNRKRMNESKNNLIKILEERVSDTKESLNLIKKEITQKANKTPLLLPLKNFDSTVLVNLVKDLYDTIVDIEDKNSAIKTTVENIIKSHPPQRIGSRPHLCMVDDRKVEYHSPGKSLHGVSRPNAGHPKECLLSGNIRLGAKFAPGFHYDCLKGNANLNGLFWGCHTAQSQRSGSPHLNIAPNDHIR